MKVLFVVTAFYPEQAIGSIRITKLAKYFQEQGVDISVISLTPPPWAARDETLHFEGLNKIRWDVIDQSWVFRAVFQKARVSAVGSGSANAGIAGRDTSARLKQRLRAAAQLAYTLSKAIDWSFRVRKHAKKHLRDKKFDFVFCSYPSIASPISGMQLKRLGIGNNLAIDFRDPLISSDANRFSFKLWLQKRMLRAADVRIFVSEGVHRQVSQKDDWHKDLVASNGFDPQDAAALKPDAYKQLADNVFRFVYTGAMYGGKRDIRPFFKAAANVLADNDFDPNNVSFEYAGSEGELFSSQAEEFGLEDRVVDHGRLTRSAALDLQQQADVCLLATWNSAKEQGVLTGKVFEYFMLRKPIVAIVGGDLGGSEISKVIQNIGAGYCFESATPKSLDNLQTWLKNALLEKHSSGALLSQYNDRVENFNFLVVAAQIREKIEQHLELQAHQ